jgi:hypothetical protein
VALRGFRGLTPPRSRVVAVPLTAARGAGLGHAGVRTEGAMLTVQLACAVIAEPPWAPEMARNL